MLDVPCGQGRLTIPLAEMGLTMTGVDQSALYLRRARRAARARGVDVRFARGDMRALDVEQQFDAVFNWFGSFGYFSDDDNARVLRCILAALKQRGRFLLEGLNKSWLLANFQLNARSKSVK